MHNNETIPVSQSSGDPLATERLSPPRRQRSVRRTISIDMQRPEGLDGVVVLRGLGRDLVTGADGIARAAAEANFDMIIEADGRIRTASAGTHTGGGLLEEFIGTNSGTGFRALLARCASPDLHPGTLLHQLLDDVPVTTMITGYMDAREGHRAPRRDASAPSFVNVCAGWKEGGASHRRMVTDNYGIVVMGPLATPLTDGGDPLAWHVQPALPAGAMRRRRRIDLWRESDELVADSILRDAFIEPHDIETLVHEYAMITRVDAETMTVKQSTAEHGALPTPDCPAATTSATQLDGLNVFELRENVRKQFRGPTTCTHLNDSLRALADISSLAALLGD